MGHLQPRQKNPVEQLPAEMVYIRFDLLCAMLQKLIHLFAFLLHDFFSDFGCAVIGVFKCMIILATDFLASCLILKLPAQQKHQF
jgi:hypothetical protein